MPLPAVRRLSGLSCTGPRLREDACVTHVAVVFPGRRYGVDMPLLRYAAQAASQVGAQVQVLQYPDWLVSADAPSEEQLQAASRAAADSLAHLVAGSSRITLLAKSLGTRVIARLPHDVLPGRVDAIWLTPILVDPATVHAAAVKTWRSLYVCGTADPSCDGNALRRIVAATKGSVLSISGGDHSLEVEGDVAASLEALTRVTAAVLQHVGEPNG